VVKSIVATEVDSFSLHALISTGVFNFFSVPVKSRTNKDF